MLYDYAAISAMNEAIEGFVGRMNSTLDDLDSEFKGLLSDGWSGQGADAFHTSSAAWHQNANAMAATLRTLARKIATAGETMHGADKTAAGNF
jgi:WXG100 family type VII secretion target